jgi:hypothetical protein
MPPRTVGSRQVRPHRKTGPGCPIVRAANFSGQRNPSAANASAKAPLTLSPERQHPIRRRRCRRRHQCRPDGSPAGGGYLVQVSSQKNEADVQVSYRAQNKFPPR